MCIIVDNDVIARVLFVPADPDFNLVHRSLYGKSAPRARLVYGGRLLCDEYGGSQRVVTAVANLDRAGRARRVPDSLVNEAETRVVQQGACTSDDPHIIALARASGARLLCSNDAALIADFTNRAIVPSPRGKVFRNSSHVHLIRDCCADLR